MTRPLSPAARAVLATVRQALLAGRVELADQADGTTLVVVLSDDGADLLRAVVRAVVRVGDPRQLALPGVPVVPPPPVELDVADLAPVWTHGLVGGDVISFDAERMEVVGLTKDGPALLPEGDDAEPIEPLWREIERTGPTSWRTKSFAADKPAPKPKAPAKPRPARLTPLPAADALTVRGQRCVVAQLHEGDAWELIWSDEMPGQMVHDDAWRAVQEQAARARLYNRGQRCVADTADGGAS